MLGAERYDGAEPVNLGVGREITIRDLVELIVRLTRFAGEIRWDSVKAGRPAATGAGHEPGARDGSDSSRPRLRGRPAPHDRLVRAERGVTRARRTRIACLVHGVGGRETGVRRLILEQAAAWSELDPRVEVGLFVRCEAGTEEAWRGEPHVVAVRSSRLGIVGRFVARELLSAQLARWRPDVIYLRHSTVSPASLRWQRPSRR